MDGAPARCTRHSSSPMEMTRVARFKRGSEMDVAHLGERVAHGIVDGAFADFAAFDVGDGNAKGQRNCSGSQHLVAVGNEQKRSGRIWPEAVRQAESSHADGLGHADVRIGTKQTLDAGGDLETVALDLADGLAKFGRKVRPHHDQFQVHFRVSERSCKRPVEMAVVGARSSDDGDVALHSGGRLRDLVLQVCAGLILRNQASQRGQEFGEIHFSHGRVQLGQSVLQLRLCQAGTIDPLQSVRQFARNRLRVPRRTLHAACRPDAVPCK